MRDNYEWLEDRISRQAGSRKRTLKPNVHGISGETPSVKVASSLPKYRNKKTEVDGITFDSKKEAARYQELKQMEQAGEISELERQPKYIFELNGFRIGSYKPDFRYFNKDGFVVVEDCKSPASKTTAYRLRKKMMAAFHLLKVLET